MTMSVEKFEDKNGKKCVCGQESGDCSTMWHFKVWEKTASLSTHSRTEFLSARCCNDEIVFLSPRKYPFFILWHNFENEGYFAKYGIKAKKWQFRKRRKYLANNVLLLETDHLDLYNCLQTETILDATLYSPVVNKVKKIAQLLLGCEPRIIRLPSWMLNHLSRHLCPIFSPW